MRAYLATPLIALMFALGVAAPAPAVQKEDKAAKRQKAMELAKAAKPVVWHDPGAVESLDFVNGPGGSENAPKAPFTFEEEDLDGSNPKVKIRDANGRRWSLKFGTEVNAEVFASRVAWAAGYFVEPSYFAASGKVEGLDRNKLTRAKKFFGEDGSFKNGRFELKMESLARLKDEDGWAWPDNPFVGTKELNGLKVVMMLTSNWDNKDVRDVSRGSNTAIYVVETPNGNEARYTVTDWGGSMGKWGGVLGREKWDADGYAKQSPQFLKVSGGKVEFGYSGQHSSDWKADVKASDVAWIAQYLARITDDQLRAGLQASGATPQEIDTFVRGIRERIDQLKQVH
jgi:hypothetical protein